MVADTVKGYPYPQSLPHLFAQQDSYTSSTSSSSSCSSALMTQSFTSPTRQRMDMNAPLPQLQGALNPVAALSSAALLGGTGSGTRKSREFTPESKKDNCYWDRRRRNNEAAKRSREKRRVSDMMLEQKVVELSKENHILKAKINAYESKYQIKSDRLVDEDSISQTLPAPEQILSIARRTTFNLASLSQQKFGSSSSLLSPNSLPGSPPSHMSSSSLHEEEYSLPPYSQAPPSSYHSSDHQQEEPLKRSYSPPPAAPLTMPHLHQAPSYYQDDNSGGALNLCARARSPIHAMDQGEDSPRVSYLPHKLRHKNRPHQSLSPPEGCYAPRPQAEGLDYSIKTEVGEESPPESTSSDDRDSGLSDSPPALSLASDFGHQGGQDTSDMDMDSQQLRAQVARISNEVHQLQYVLNKNNSVPAANGLLMARR